MATPGLSHPLAFSAPPLPLRSLQPLCLSVAVRGEASSPGPHSRHCSGPGKDGGASLVQNILLITSSHIFITSMWLDAGLTSRVRQPITVRSSIPVRAPPSCSSSVSAVVTGEGRSLSVKLPSIQVAVQSVPELSCQSKRAAAMETVCWGN